MTYILYVPPLIRRQEPGLDRLVVGTVGSGWMQGAEGVNRWSEREEEKREERDVTAVSVKSRRSSHPSLWESCTSWPNTPASASRKISCKVCVRVCVLPLQALILNDLRKGSSWRAWRWSPLRLAGIKGWEPAHFQEALVPWLVQAHTKLEPWAQSANQQPGLIQFSLTASEPAKGGCWWNHLSDDSPGCTTLLRRCRYFDESRVGAPERSRLPPFWISFMSMNSHYSGCLWNVFFVGIQIYTGGVIFSPGPPGVRRFKIRRCQNSSTILKLLSINGKGPLLKA